MHIIADTHTHTLACDHAYSTLSENIAQAAKIGLRALAMTEHGPEMLGAPSLLHFSNLTYLPPEMDGVLILKGVEANIMDREGTLDIPDWILGRLDWVIASMHTPTWPPETQADHTSAWLAIANNPHVDVIGHCGDGRYPFDEETVIREFARTGKIVEINSHSFTAREGSEVNCPRIAEKCAREGVRVVVSSDAHFYTQIGVFDNALRMLKEIHFPEELVLNADYERFLAVARQTASPRMQAFLNTSE